MAESMKDEIQSFLQNLIDNKILVIEVNGELQWPKLEIQSRKNDEQKDVCLFILS